MEALDDICVLELLRHGEVVDDGEEGELAGNDVDDGVIGGGNDRSDLMGESIFLEDLHLSLEDILVVQLEQFFVGEIDAELFETVVIEVLKAEDVEDVDGVVFLFGTGSQCHLNFVQNELEDCIVYCLSHGVDVPV